MATTTTTGGGEHLKRVRETAGISQSELGRRCGLSQAYISQIEGGGKPLSAYAAICVEVGLDLEPRTLVRYAEDLPDTLASHFPGYLNRILHLLSPAAPALA